ncbi:23S rRNA (uracil(1939)-C(5))-methyltransferase RlmD [Candidatus Gracilibacteria bacterium]|nr:23S rRNA (uracil(1939)-C(5))-methyltransferase RlmD [Candidatus Gracilibacteria bacterium]
MTQLKKGGVYEAKIENLGFGGEGIAKIDDFVIFIKGGIPGQKVKFVLQKKKKSHGNGKLQEVLEKSNIEISAKCQHFGKCGGCKWQNLDYKKQLEYKENQVKESLKHIGKFDLETINFSPILGSPEIFGYRNKVEFSFGYQEMRVETDEDGNKKFFDTGETAGFHKPGKFQEIVDIANCDLITENANQVFQLIKTECLKFSKEVFNPYSHKGLWRHILIRENLKGELMINLIINLFQNKYKNQRFNTFLENLAIKLQNFGNGNGNSNGVHNGKLNYVKNFFYTNNPGLNDDWAKYEVHKIFGEDEFIEENILGLNFKISAKSFFQTNSGGAEVLYSQVKKFSDEIFANSEKTTDKIFIDLYCGTGTIGQILAKDSDAQVVGIEYIESAVEDAKENSKLNNLTNTEFICGKVEEKLPELLEEFQELDLIVIDPPRAGMHKKAIETIMNSEAKNLIYVSCNPSTFARDAQIFAEKYVLEKVQAVDMFPHTSHIELVAKFKLK